ncbi:MAG TPA: CpsD/CapB family tyrosine-protein kinase [Edaphobacter sp.]
MSRIYEALQKAESERKLERHEREAFVPEQVTNNPVPVRTASAVAEEYDAASMQAMTGHLTDVFEPSPLMRDRVSGIDMNKIAQRPWSPVLSQLPALFDRGPSVEQFRSLRSRIYELRDISPLKSILVSSGLPQEGKSFVSANLAISLARHKGSKVLLIDGDMRRYTAHEMLGCESEPGLAEYLAGKASIEEVMQRPDASDANGSGKLYLTNLTFIPGGNGGDKAADLSGNPRFNELIKLAEPHFDWIIVDSSPVLPVSDAVNLARSCDGVLLVARGGVTKFPVAQRAASELKASNILGFVLNAVEDKPQVGDYYGYNANKE